MRTIQQQTRLFQTNPRFWRRCKTIFSAGRTPVLRKTNFRTRGFTLIELMVVVTVVAILAAIALPSYSQYVKKSRARSATSDLVALSLNLENIYQRTLTYPPAASSVTTTAGAEALAPGWHASEAQYFNYSVDSSAASYTLTASGQGNMSGCNLTLGSNNARTVTQGNTCGGLTSW